MDYLVVTPKGIKKTNTPITMKNNPATLERDGMVVIRKYIPPISNSIPRTWTTIFIKMFLQASLILL